ncbi:MAG: enoyl-CoA hydratase/isomerase family protein [Proteobacteria bacterium]|nr:enoyl-CoA hydratase/isomerase family protein [Pseudomonadota bacterium]MBU2228483.1 enoyl-CoA hydratase/isomerase family protein [Pseudomonadota bacterium]MBU2261384.1 enoyl-CoA hydratase/isomerase family protein [Pseudomonadota bacterium]
MTVIVEKKEHVGYITLNRPEVLNALDNETLHDFWGAWAVFGDDPEVWVILITGAGEKAFSVGRDLKKYKEGQGVPKVEHVFEPVCDIGLGHAAKVDKPVIAAVNGYALGWGFTIVLLTDIRIACENAVFGYPEVTYGLPTGVGSLLLPRDLSWCRSMEVLLTGDRIGAQEALRLGLVNRVVPKGEAFPAAESVARRICENGPLAVKATKRMARMGLEMPFESARQQVETLRYILRQTEDAKEGPRAFAERRKPRYRGE